jgi:ornithine decarboxylase
VNDGVYGSFNCILFDHAVVEPKVLWRDDRFHYDDTFESTALSRCSVWGPTCDSMDCITKNALLPELDVGDWLYFPNMGAYTMCAASTFNGFKKSHVFYTNTEKGSESLDAKSMLV